MIILPHINIPYLYQERSAELEKFVEAGACTTIHGDAKGIKLEQRSSDATTAKNLTTYFT